MGYDSIFDSRQLNLVYGAFPFPVCTYRAHFLIHRLNSPRLTQALCLTLLFFRLLFYRPPPKVHREGIPQLDQFSHPAWRERMYCLDLFSFGLWLWIATMGTYAVYLCFYASLSYEIKTVMKM